MFTAVVATLVTLGAPVTIENNTSMAFEDLSLMVESHMQMAKRDFTYQLKTDVSVDIFNSVNSISSSQNDEHALLTNKDEVSTAD
jgi:hypothetical protein